jgi:diguanylate cyclase (GGDEF)-like protein
MAKFSKSWGEFRARYPKRSRPPWGEGNKPEFRNYVREQLDSRGGEHLWAKLTPGDRLHYVQGMNYITPERAGRPLFYDAMRRTYTQADTGIPGVFQGYASVDLDDERGIPIFPSQPMTRVDYSRLGDALYYHRDDQGHWYDTNPAGGQPLYSAVGEGGLETFSLQGDKPAIYRPSASTPPPASTQTPNLFGKLQEYHPSQEIIHPNPNPTSLVVPDAHGNNVIVPVGAAANDLAGSLGYGIDAPTSGVSRGLMSQAGARTGLNDLFKAAGSAVSGAFNTFRQYMVRSATSRYTDTSHTRTTPAQGKFADLPKAEQQRAVAVEVIRRTAKADNPLVALGNWWENNQDQTNLIPVNRGTLIEVGDDKFQATLDRGDVEWMTWDEYMAKKTELSFTQARDYFQSFTDDPRPDTIVEAEKLGWKKPALEDERSTDVFGRTYRQSLANMQGATAYASFVENSAAEFIAKHYEQKDAQAWKARERGDYAAGQRLRVEAIQAKRLSGRTGVQDPYFAYSWIENKEGETKFIETVAAMEMQLGRPLDDLEVWRARDQFVNPYTEFAGDAVFDWTNIAGGFLEAPVRKLLKPLGSVAAQAIKQANLPVVTPLVRYFGERSVRSAAGRFAHGANEVFMGIAHSVGGEGSDGFIKRLDEVGKAVAGGLPAEGDVVKLLNLPAEFAGRQERILLGLGNAFSSNPQLARKELLSTDWGALGDAAHKEVWQKAYDAAEKQGAKQGLVDEALMKFARDEADKIANDPTNLVPVMASKFREGYLSAFAVQPGKLQAGLNKAMDFWTAAVLSSRPAWMFRNWADNTFRYLVFGGNPFDGLDLLVGRVGRVPEIAQKLNQMGTNPTELTETFARATLNQGGETVAQRLNLGWRPNGFWDFFTYAGKRAADQRELSGKWQEFLLDPSFKGGMKQLGSFFMTAGETITGGITDWNAAVEYAFKIRMFDQQFTANMTRLSAYGKKRVLQQLKQAGASERVQGVMGKVWDQFYTDPEAMRRMVTDLHVGNTSTFQVISKLVPDNLDDMLSMIEPSARAEFTRTVVENMKTVMETARLNGQKFDSDSFFDDLLDNFRKQKAELLNQIDTRDAADTNLNGKAVAGEVDLTPSNGAVPQAAEASAFTEVKKSVPEAVAALKNARDPKAIASNVRDAVGRRWNVVEAPKGSKPYLVTVENGKVTLAISPDVAKMQGKEARAAMRDAVAEAVAKEKGFDAADVRKFLDNPAVLKAEKAEAFQQLADFFDNEPDLRQTLAGLQGKKHLDYHTHAAYPDDDFKVEITEGGIQKNARPHRNPEVGIQGKRYQGSAAHLNDAKRAAGVNSYKGNFLGEVYDSAQIVHDRIRHWQLNVYPGPKSVSDEFSGKLWDMSDDMLLRDYEGYARFFDQIVDSVANLSDADMADFPRPSLSQILGQTGHTFAFKEDGSLRRVVYHPSNPTLKYTPPSKEFALNKFIQSMFGPKAVNGPHMRQWIMELPYNAELARGVLPEISEVTSEVVEQAVKQIDDEIVEMTADLRTQVKKTLGLELDETGTKKLVERRDDSRLRAVIDKVQHNEGLSAEEAKILLDGTMVQSTGLRNKIYWEKVVEGREKELPYKVALDLDFLKWFNDTGGHPLGDQLLKAYAEDLARVAGQDNAFHLSGDEFLAMFPDQTSAERAMVELEQAFSKRTFVFKEFKDGKETGNAVTATGITFGWGGGDTAKSADGVLIARKQASKLTRGKEPGGVARAPRSDGLEPQRVEGGAGQTGREYVALSEAELAQIEALKNTPTIQPGRKLPKAVKEKVEADLGIKLTPDGTQRVMVTKRAVQAPVAAPKPKVKPQAVLDQIDTLGKSKGWTPQFTATFKQTVEELPPSVQEWIGKKLETDPGFIGTFDDLPEAERAQLKNAGAATWNKQSMHFPADKGPLATELRHELVHYMFKDYNLLSMEDYEFGDIWRQAFIQNIDAVKESVRQAQRGEGSEVLRDFVKARMEWIQETAAKGDEALARDISAYVTLDAMLGGPSLANEIGIPQNQSSIFALWRGMLDEAGIDPSSYVLIGDEEQIAYMLGEQPEIFEQVFDYLLHPKQLDVQPGTRLAEYAGKGRDVNNLKNQVWEAVHEDGLIKRLGYEQLYGDEVLEFDALREVAQQMGYDLSDPVANERGILNATLTKREPMEDVEELVDLSPAEHAKVTEQLQRQQAVYAARTRLYQPVNKIKDPASRALVQTEAQEMMLDVFAIDGFEGKPLSAAEFKEALRQYSWATKLVDKLPDNNPRRTLVEALMQVVSGEGAGDELADGLRKLTAYNLENGVSMGGKPTRLAHPHIRQQMLHEDIEDLTKQWTEGLKRDPMQEMTQLRESHENAQALWEAYSQQPWVNNKPIAQAWGQFARDPQLLAAHLRDLIANLPDGVSDETIEGLQMFLWQVQNFHAVSNNTAEKLGLLRSTRAAASTYIPLSKTVTQLPDNFASFFARTGEGAAQLSGFEESMKTWKGHAKAAADLPEVNLAPEEVGQLADLADDAARLKQNLVNLAAYGEEPRLYDQISDTLGIEVNKKLTKKRVDGKWVDLEPKERDAITRLQNNLAEQAEIARAVGGVSEGALEKTNRYMIDYGSSMRVDEWAKKAIPFWTFSSRSYPFWLETLGTHPEILSFYQKYIALNRRVQVQGGIQTTRGDQLPSLEGYVPIPGTDLWFNPTAAFSFRYILPNFRTYQDEYEDQPVMAQVFTYLYENSNALGVGLAPYLTVPAQNMGWLEGKPTNAIIPQVNLLPPWWIASVRGKLSEFAGPEAVKVFNTGFGADAPWQDFMVERRLLANALAKMQANPTRAKAIAAEIRNALDNREQTELWNTTYNEIKSGDYGTAMLGYFSGIYAKDFTDAEVDFLRLRDEVYALRGMVNDTIGAELFDREGSPTQRYDQYTDRLYQTPEGYTANVYNMLRYVTTDDGKTPNPEERRELISKSLDQDANLQAYYQAMSEASNRYQAELAALPIGADSALRQAAYQKFMTERDGIRADFPGLLPSWTIGYKPEEMVFDNFADEFWKAVQATKPRREADEAYEDWQLRVAQWQGDIPTIMTSKADVWLPILARELKLEPEQLARQTQVELPGGRSLDIPALTQELLKQATVEGYTDWKKRKDSALDALDAGWTAMYYDKYWDYLKGKSGYERDMAERQFLEQRPKPSTEELIQWVSQEYPGRWTPQQLKQWIEGRRMETVESRLAPKDENEQMAQEVWDILAWAGPNKKKLQAEFENLGGYWSSVNMWWESGGRPEAWKDPEDFQKVYDLLKQAARKLHLTDPDRATLQEWNQAQKLDAQLKDLYEKELGADYLEIMSEYWNADSRTRRSLRKQYPLIDQYYDLRDAWIKQNPVWAKYYTEQEEDKKASGSGGGYGSGGYRRRSGGGGGGGWVDYPERGYTVGLGGRSSLDVDVLPGSLGKGGVSRGVPIPKSVAQLLGEAAVKSLEEGALGPELHDYVKGVAKRHPEHKNTWEQIMAKMEGQNKPI